MKVEEEWSPSPVQSQLCTVQHQRKFCRSFKSTALFIYDIRSVTNAGIKNCPDRAEDIIWWSETWLLEETKINHRNSSFFSVNLTFNPSYQLLMLFLVIMPPAQPPIFGRIMAPAIATAGLLKNSIFSEIFIKVFKEKQIKPSPQGQIATRSA